MTNTSAYANVLLTAPVAAPSVAVPKRDSQNERSPTNFHQTLKNVHEDRRRDDKVTKPAAHKKTTPAEQPQDLKENKNVKGASVQKKSTNDSVAVGGSGNKGGVREQLTPENRKSELRESVIATPAVNEFNEDAISGGATTPTNIPPQDLALSGLNLATPRAVSIDALSLNAGGLGLNIEALGLGTNDPTQLAAQLDPLQLNPDIAISSELGAGIPIAENLAMQLVNSATVETDKSLLAASNNSQDLNLAQQLANTSPAIPANQPITPVMSGTEQVLAAGMMTPAMPAKLLQPQVAVGEVAVAEESLDATETLASLALAVNTSSSVSLTPTSQVPPKAATTQATTTQATTTQAPTSSALISNAPTSNTLGDATTDAANTEATTAQAQMQASKSAFEKTLQATVSPDASGADDIAASVPNSSSTSSATNPLMDTLMRGMDQQTPAARSFVVQTSIPVPVGQPQWSQAVGEKVLWLAAQNVSSAEINLHPKDLGPMQVKVSVNQEQVTVSFTSQHAVVREVLDQNLNRLRDMFSEQGLNLVNVDVSDKSFSRHQGDAKDQKSQGGTHDVTQDEEVPIAMSAIVQQRLVDHYA